MHLLLIVHYSRGRSFEWWSINQWTTWKQHIFHGYPLNPLLYSSPTKSAFFPVWFPLRSSASSRCSSVSVGNLSCLLLHSVPPSLSSLSLLWCASVAPRLPSQCPEEVHIPHRPLCAQRWQSTVLKTTNLQYAKGELVFFFFCLFPFFSLKGCLPSQLLSNMLSEVAALKR